MLNKTAQKLGYFWLTCRRHRGKVGVVKVSENASKIKKDFYNNVKDIDILLFKISFAVLGHKHDPKIAKKSGTKQFFKKLILTSFNLISI